MRQETSINPINRHKSEIEKRLNQLQLKFQQNQPLQKNTQHIVHLQEEAKGKGKARGKEKSSQRFIQYGKTINLLHNEMRMQNDRKTERWALGKQNMNRTLDVRQVRDRPNSTSIAVDGMGQGQIKSNISQRQQQLFNDRKRYSPQRNPYKYIDNVQAQQNRDQNSYKIMNTHKNENSLNPKKDDFRKDDKKDEEIRQLKDMVKMLLDGHKRLEDQVNELKNKNKITQSQLQERDKSLLEENTNIPQEKQERSNERFKERSQDKMNKRKTPLKQKKRQFEELYMKLKSRRSQSQSDSVRIVVSEGERRNFWGEVQTRIRQSQQEYRDTLHRNSKHEFDHLMSTYELQRKMKDDLISKVYNQCNQLIYK